jgi:predicted Zn-dependent protease
MGLLFLRFGRDAERQADDLGLRYMLRGGYDPREMPKMFEMLETVSSLGEGGRAPDWLSTHPNPDARGQRSEAAIARLEPSQLQGIVGREDHLARIDGVVFGADPRQGYFVGDSFLHPELAFGLDFPSGWKTVNTRAKVVAVAPSEDMVIELTLSESASASAGLQKFVSQQGVTAGRTWSRKVNGLTATGARFEATSGTQALRGTVMYVEHGGNVYALLGYGLAAPVEQRIDSIESSLRSFHAVTDRQVRSVEPDRLRLVALEQPMTLRAFQQRYPSVIELDELAALNRVEPDETLEAGTTVKRVVGERPRPVE